MLKALAVLYIVLNELEVVRGKYDTIFEESENVLTEKNNFAKYIGDVIVAHTDFEVILHFDNANWNIVDKVIANINVRTIKSVNLICYSAEGNITDSNSNLFERPLVRKVLNVIILNEMDMFALFINATENVNERDEALFVFPTLDFNATFLMSNRQVKLFGKVLVINFISHQEINTSAICYFCGKTSGKFVQIASNGIIPVNSKIDLTQKEFKDFYKHRFKVAFTEYYPFIWCEVVEKIEVNNDTINACAKTKGTEYELINMMARKLNFRFDLILYADYAPLIEDLVDGKIDFVIGGITSTSDRAQRATFTKQYWFEGYYFLYVLSTNLKQELGRVLEPFQGHLWLLFTTSICVTSVVLYALDRVESAAVERISCSDSLWVCLYMAIEQNTNIKQVFRVRTGPAVLLVAWILVCLNVSTAYKSKLSAMVINPPHREPSDLNELVENDYTFVVNQRYRDVFVALLMNTTDPVVQGALSLTDGKNGLCEEFVFAVENRAAILDEYTSLQFELRRICKGELRAKRLETEDIGGTRIRITRKSLRTIGQVWLLQKKAAYRSGFDEVMSQIVEAGLVEMWRRFYTKEMLKDSFPESRNTNTERYHSPLALRRLLSLFLVYAIGNCCAIVVFAIESFCNRRNLELVPRKGSLEQLWRHEAQ